MDVFEMGDQDAMGEVTHMCFLDMLALMCGTPPLTPTPIQAQLSSLALAAENVPLPNTEKKAKKVRVDQEGEQQVKAPKAKRPKKPKVIHPIVDGCNCEVREPQTLTTGDLRTTRPKRVHHLILDLPAVSRSPTTPTALEYMVQENWHVCHLKVKFFAWRVWDDTIALPSVLRNLRGLQSLDITELKLARAKHGIALQAQFEAGEHSATLRSLCMVAEEGA